MKKILLIVIGVVVCACLVSIPPWAGSSATSKQVIHGDINVIGTGFNITNKHYQMDGNITVKDGGTLILKNVILEFLQDEYKKYHFTVDSGSKLVMENTYLFVTANQTRPYLKFTMTVNDRSECFINNSTIAFPGWLNVANSNLTFFNSIIKKVDFIPGGMSVDDNDDCPLLFFNTSNIIMINSKVENYYEDSGLPAALDLHSQIQNLTASDGSVVEVKYNENLTVNQLNSSELLRLPTNRLTAAMLEVTYATERYYNGTNFIEWSQDGISYENTSSQPRNQNKTTEENYIEKYDLWLQGIRTVEEACNVYIRFINNDNESGDSESNVSFDRIRLVVSYENDIVLINSSLYAFNTYLDVDFKPADADPTSSGTQETTQTTYLEDSSYDHNTLRALENSELYLYNVTVKDIYQPDSDPPFLTDISSEAFIYRLLTVNVLDGVQMPLSNARIDIFYYEDKTPVEYPSDLVLACIGRTSQNYNQTDIYGNVIFPLLSDIISPEDWPNTEFVGGYSINISYKQYRSSQNVNLTQYPLISAQDNSPIMTCTFTELIPDLTPAIYLSTSTPTDGDTVEIIATIYNNGTTNAYNISITFYDNDQEFDEKIIPVVNYNESVQISANWTPTTAGNHTIYVAVDSNNLIAESNENNNFCLQNVTVFSRPDLYIKSIGFSDYYPIENDTITIFCTVGNSGETNATCDIEFYANSKRIATENIFVPKNSTKNTSCPFNTSGECGNVNITLRIANCTPVELNFVNNEMNSTLRIYSARSRDWILETNRTIERDYEAQKNIIIRNCDFIISNATLTIPQDAPEQYRIIVLQNARIIFYNSTVKSDYQLYLYVYNSTLSSTNSTLSLNITCSGSADVTLSGTILNGMINVVCNNFTAKNTVFNSSSVIINAISINIENSNITNISASHNISMQAQEIQARNTSMSAAAIFENGTAHLVNVTVPSVTVKNAVVYRYWWLKVIAEDKAGSKLQNATIRIFSRDKGVEGEYLLETYKTDSEGIATLQLLAEERGTTYPMNYVNYMLNITYENETIFEDFKFKNNTAIKKTYPIIFITPTALELTLQLSSSSVDAGRELTVSGTVKYNIGSKPGVAKVTVTITIGGTPYTTETDATGSYSRNITVPGTGGSYTVVVSAADSEFNVQGSDQKTLFVQAPPAKPVDIIPIIIAIIVIVVVVIICVIKRKLLKAYLIVLKAKVKKEEFTECTECSKNIPSLLKKCPYCDTEFGEEKEAAEEERAKCSECGALIPVSAKKCPKCGATFEE